MNEDRTPKQISGDFVLCNDNTLWKWINGDLMVLTGWRKLPNIPSDDEYEVLQKERQENEIKWMEAQCSSGTTRIGKNK